MMPVADQVRLVCAVASWLTVLGAANLVRVSDGALGKFVGVAWILFAIPASAFFTFAFFLGDSP